MLQRRTLIGFSLLCLPLWLGNRGCDPDQHEAEAEGDTTSSAAEPGANDTAAPSPGSTAPNSSTAPNPSTKPAPAPLDASAPNPTRDASVTPVRDAAAPGGLRCGTRGGVQCAADQFCDFPAASQCGALDQGGTCQPKTTACTKIYKPVCGCDGNTYGNACEAHSKGVSVASEGECGKPAPTPTTDAGSGGAGGKMCGGFAGIQCAKGQFCNYEVAAGGQGCDGIADGAGTCQSIPQACTLEYNPVCGCDRRTYGTACAAHAAGVSVLRAGMCTDTDCKAIGGHAVDGIGPAPKCAANETDYGAIRYAGGQIAIEGTICCVPK